MRDFVFEAAEAYYHKNGKVAQVKEMYDEAQDRFSMIHILIAIAHTEALKAIDTIDDKGLRKHLVKKHLKEYEKEHGAYVSFMMRHMTNDAWSLLQDYATCAQSKIEYKCQLIRQACYNYLKKNGIDNASLYAQCEVAALMWKIVTETYDLYFQSYKEACGVDFRKDYTYADMTKASNEWRNVTYELSRNARDIDFSNDKRWCNAWEDLKASIDNIDFFDSAAAKALSRNPEMLERYKDEI